jgi:Trm5-related predicted tRNA methylase
MKCAPCLLQVVSEERPYLERFADRKDDLVYLTADAEETIQELDASKVYIIGGIVDRNRHKVGGRNHGHCETKGRKEVVPIV